MKTNPQTWFEVLQGVRNLSSKGHFGSHDLAREMGFKDTLPSAILSGPNEGKMGKGSTAQQIAAGWLSKFQKWGYVVVTGEVDTGAPRAAFVFKVTPEGMTCKERVGIKGKLQLLVEAVDRFVALKGKPTEIGAWKDLQKVLGEVRPKADEDEE